MCGIIGYIGKQDALPVLIEGLRRLEYRGYDSAGVAFFQERQIAIRRAVGKLRNLEAALGTKNGGGQIGIGHVRWATHGAPSEENAHPHRAGGVAVVHNGIIENYRTLKRALLDAGETFASETDTEVICHLIARQIRRGHRLPEAVRLALREVEGDYAIAVLSDQDPETLVAARSGSPLVVGLGSGESFVASDIPAILGCTRDVIFLGDGEIVVLTPEGVRIQDLEGQELDKEVTHVLWNPVMAEKGGYKHFMLKEIHEQPRAILDTIRGRFSHETGALYLDELRLSEETLRGIERVTLTACGTSWHAALVGRFYLEGLARIPTTAEIASELRYRNPLLGAQTLVVAITQSGETTDTLGALREARRLGARTAAVCNVLGSTASREADGVFYTHAGPEIGVASTKAFTTQLAALFLFALHLGRVRGVLSQAEVLQHLEDLIRLPHAIEQVLGQNEAILRIARRLHACRDFLYLGRHLLYPIALEGALKLKEISYIHAEGYPAGEMKHGPIALVDGDLPVVILAPRDKVYDKVLNAIEEVKARGGAVIALVQEGDTAAAERADFAIAVPETPPWLTPILMAVPLQLLAYHIADLRGNDVDQPRNLAKSVTVE
jgi:glucosamine--fructose-6-phosphate aminotransferase (isomerizing)